MTPTNNGNYIFCNNCIHKISDKSKYPCRYSHRTVRGKVRYERDFTTCLKKDINDKEQIKV